ncbi:MAG: substrate-binding domain-containing protein [Treponema sp.]|nr:substrate-binding domain-containing protein [Treponema sp.]
MKKTVVVIVSAILLSFLVTGCTKSAEPETKKIRIGVSFATQVAARFQFDERFMQETAEALGAELLVQWANYDQTRQENQVENLITQDIDALILVAVSTNMAPLVEKVKAEGIPVVCYDNFIENAPLDAYLDRDNQEAGRIQMRAAAAAIGGKGNVAIIHGEPTSAVVQGMRTGYHEILESYPDINVVTEQYCEGYSAEKALRIAENALSANNDSIGAFICTSDVLTLGILPAIEAAGLSGKAFLTGMDCEVAAMQAVDKGIIGIDIWTEIDKCAIRSVEIACALVRGEKFEYDNLMGSGSYQIPKIFVPILGVNRDNMENWVTNVAPGGWISIQDIRG